MKIPKTLRIGAMTWEVIHSEDVTEEGSCHGSVHYQDQKIFIKPNMKPENEARTFLHEILHAISWTSGLDDVLEQAPPKELDELMCGHFDVALLQVIQDNDLDFRS